MSIKGDKNKLGELRCEIVLNSIYKLDYDNSFNLDLDSVYMFFKSYVEYLSELSKECNDLLKLNNVNISSKCYKYTDGLDFDNKDNLYNGGCCYDCDDDKILVESNRVLDYDLRNIKNKW